MVGHVQQFKAPGVRERVAQMRAANQRGDAPERVTPVLSGLPSKAELLNEKAGNRSAPSPLPLDAAEADLCERLTNLLSHAPHRHREDAAVAPIELSDRIATAAEVVPEPADLPPLPELPEVDATTPTPALLAIRWVQRSKRERLKSALRYSTAWTVTLGVIAVTIVGATLLTLGPDTSSNIAAKASRHGAEAALAAIAKLWQLAGQ